MIYILIPSFNDSENFNLLLRNIGKKLRSYSYKVTIVDDGSTDQTLKVISHLSRRYPVRRIGYKKNRGSGYAFKFGFTYIIPRLKKNDILITMEADNSSDFAILTKMVEFTKKYDVILSSPFAKGGKFIKLDSKRRILSEIASILDRVIFRIKNVKTYASFYRAYRPDILKRAIKVYGNNLITETGFSAVVEVLIKLHKLGATVDEIPAILNWDVRRGKSKMKITKTIINHLLIYKNYFIGKYNP